MNDITIYNQDTHDALMELLSEMKNWADSTMLIDITTQSGVRVSCTVMQYLLGMISLTFVGAVVASIVYGVYTGALLIPAISMIDDEEE